MLSQEQPILTRDGERSGSSIEQDWQAERDVKNIVRAVEKSRRRLRLRTKVEEPVFISPSPAAELDREFCAFLLTITPNEYGRVIASTIWAPLTDFELMGHLRVPASHRENTWPSVILPIDCLHTDDVPSDYSAGHSLGALLLPSSPPTDKAERADWRVPQKIVVSPLAKKFVHGGSKLRDAEQRVSLPINSDFAPSKRLVAYWRRGIEHYAKLAERNESNPFAGAETSTTLDSVLRSEFRNRLWSTVIMQLRRARDHDVKRVDVVRKNRYFSEEMETVISNTFALVPRDMTPFLEMLSEELYSYFSDGGQKAGEWGRIERADQAVVAILSAKKVVQEPASNAREFDVKV